MSNICKLINFTKNVRAIYHNVATAASRNISPTTNLLNRRNALSHSKTLLTRSICTTTMLRTDLMQFFDDPKNWSENEVKVGRAWKTDELRIKSNKELHQLWYLLLKERNMLLTMEHECNDKMEFFPSPERLDKVKISMTNLEEVVRERNRAYHLLETGKDGERPSRLAATALGLKRVYRSFEHVMPSFRNTKWLKSQHLGFEGNGVRKFLRFYREKLWNEKRKANVRARNEVMMQLRRNPHLDQQMLQQKFPNVNVQKVANSDKIRGHYVPNIEAK